MLTCSTSPCEAYQAVLFLGNMGILCRCAAKVICCKAFRGGMVGKARLPEPWRGASVSVCSVSTVLKESDVHMLLDFYHLMSVREACHSLAVSNTLYIRRPKLARLEVLDSSDARCQHWCNVARPSCVLITCTSSIFLNHQTRVPCVEEGTEVWAYTCTLADLPHKRVM